MSSITKNDKTLRHLLLGISASTMMVMMAAPSYAADEQAAADSTDKAAADEGEGDAIVVYARRKAETILEVPVSATVLTGDALREQNAQSALDYLKETPNVSFAQSGRNGAREIVISIRGISDLKGGEKISTQSAFTTFVDDFSAGTLASSQANPNIYDVEAVEVLRGPQGVFFGRNSEAGAINIRTKKPTSDLGGQIDVGYGRFNSYEVAGVANVPVSDTLYTRLTVQATKTDSYWKNAFKVASGKPGNGGNEYVNLRGQIRWVPTDATTVDLGVNYTIDNQDYTPKLSTCINPSFGFNPFDPNVLGGLGCYSPNGEFAAAVADGTVVLPAGVTLASVKNNTNQGYQNSPEFTDNRVTIVTGKIEHTFNDAVTFTSVTGYSTSTQDQLLDLDKGGLDVVNRSGYFETSSFSEEVRLSSAGDKALNWTVGGIYYTESFDAVNKILIQDFLGPWMRGDYANENKIGVDRKGYGFFGNVKWNLTDALALTVGARYSHDKDSQLWTEVYTACPLRVLGTPLSAGCVLRPDQVLQTTAAVSGGVTYVTGGRRSQTSGTGGTKETNDLSGQVALNYNPNEDLNIYASVSRGYKPGGARANPDSGTLSNVSLYNKERLTNYEIGGNVYLADRAALIQFAAFYMDWRDMQVELRETFCTNDPANPIPVDDFVGPGCLLAPLDRTVNANKARSQGFELSGQIRPTAAITLRAGVGYVDAKFIDFRDTVRNTPADLSGLRLANAPQWTGFAGANYAFTVGKADADIGINWNYRSSAAQGVVETVGNKFPTQIPAFGTVDLNAGLDFGNHKFSFNAKNILGSDYYTGSDSFSIGGTLIDRHPTEWFVRWSIKM